MDEKKEKVTFLGDFIIENNTDLQKLSKYVFAVKTGDTTYRPQLKKEEQKKDMTVKIDNTTKSSNTNSANDFFNEIKLIKRGV